jgi:hypothetical protein
VDPSSYQPGAEAAQRALDRVAKKDSPVRRIVLRTELRIRDSGAAPPEIDLADADFDEEIALGGRVRLKRTSAVQRFRVSFNAWESDRRSEQVLIHSSSALFAQGSRTAAFLSAGQSRVRGNYRC